MSIYYDMLRCSFKRQNSRFYVNQSIIETSRPASNFGDYQTEEIFKKIYIIAFDLTHHQLVSSVSWEKYVYILLFFISSQIK